ncbi:hypothetical protein Tco_1078049 [Tanacetum coccineum]
MPRNEDKLWPGIKRLMKWFYVMVDQTKKFLSSRFSMMDMWDADVILDILNMKYSYGYKPDIAFAVGKISNTEDKSSTSGWVFLLSGGGISWAFKKQTCITSSIMEYVFVALAAVGKEAEWLIAKCTNGVVSIEFVRFQRNLANYLRKGLARHLVLNSAEGMSLKSNLVTECQDIRLPFEKTWELSSMWKDKHSVN